VLQEPAVACPLLVNLTSCAAVLPNGSLLHFLASRKCNFHHVERLSTVQAMGWGGNITIFRSTRRTTA
jgi:hypothetical protein